MLQPFEHFRKKDLNTLVDLGKHYLVSQTYTRAEGQETAILLTDYADRGAANIHFNAVKHDKYASVIDLKKEKHREKLEEMLSKDSKYRVYWAVIKSRAQLKERIDRNYKLSINRCIQARTNWRMVGDKQIKPNMEVTFGELFMVFKYSGQVLRVKFEEVENA